MNTWRMAAALSGIVVLAGCGGMHDDETSPDAIASVDASITAMTTEIDRHRDNCSMATSLDGEQQETARYMGAMDGLMPGMRTAQNNMGSCTMMGGMMSGMNGKAAMSTMMDGMMSELDHHRSEMASMTDVKAAQAACSAHHDRMKQKLDDMHGQAGMAHCGMM